MIDLIKDWFERVSKSRVFPIVIIYTLLLSVLVHRLFVLQIVNGEEITQESEKKKDKERYVKGTRGSIYDCNGELLAYNELSYSVTIEDKDELTTNKEKNAMIYKLLKILKKNDCDVDIDFQIEKNKKGKFVFNVEGNTLLNFKRDAFCLSSVDKLSQKQLDATAEEMFEYLRYEKSTTSPRFEISDEYTEEEALEIMAVRFELLLNRYKKYLPITVASNIDEQTLIAIKENSADLPGVEVTTDTYRKYNDSKYFSHVIGYTGVVNEDEMAKLKEEKRDSEYTEADQIGKTGIEKEYESYLHGARGYEKITVNQSGRVLDVTDKKKASSGNDIYLTIDSKLQKACYDFLEKKLANILLANIIPGKGSGTKGSSSDGIKISIYEVYFALIDNNVIDITTLNDKNASDIEKKVYQKYINKRKDAFQKLKSILSVNSTKTAKDLSKEYQTYQSYIYSFLKNEGILIVDKIDESSAKYRAYKNDKIGLSEFLQYAISNSWVDLTKLEIGEDYYSSEEIYNKLLKYTFKNLKEDKAFAKKLYYYLIDNGTIYGYELCVILFEQGVLAYDEQQIASLLAGTVSPYTFLRKQIQDLKITPAMLALDPCSGSVIVTDPDTGEVKACVSYPGYDTNKFANRINTEYYYKLYEDKSYPTLYRAVQQRTAPGSTYKPLVSIAALTEGYISTGTKIYDKVAFEKIASRPKCWSNYSHGNINVSQAIEHSCNYFFYQVGFDMSDSATNHTKGLKILKKYAKMFGFDATSGLSASEYSPKISDSDAVRSAIGQGSNSYTPSQISRYCTTLANKEKCYDLNIVAKVKDTKGKIVLKNKAKVHNEINISSTTWNAVYQGMYGVVNGKDSTVKQYFKDLDVKVAGKTGTAQESKSRPNHGLFISFAPYNNPEICTTVVIPNGYSSANAAEVASNVYKYYFAGSEKAKKKVLKQAASSSGSSSGAQTD